MVMQNIDKDAPKVPIWNKKYCPCLMGEGGYIQCKEKIVRDFQSRVCNTQGYVNCFHFCKRYNLLKKPFEWLQVEAVEKSKVSTNNANTD